MPHDAAALSGVHALLSTALQKIAGVELYPGLSRPNLHHPPRAGLEKARGESQRVIAFRLAQDEVMVVAAANAQLFMIVVYTFPYGTRRREVKWRSGN
jgi:hypothetical protein